MLEDGLMHQATAEIMHEGKPRTQVQREIKAKEKAREHLSRRYASATLTSEEILNVLYSISDNNAYLRFNRDPVDRMLDYLRSYFDPKSPEPGFSLGITVGMGGARLSHNHERQYTYVMQSMMLWREVSNDMFKLWYLAEGDLLREGGRYQLTNTGQGLNRVQSAPGVNKAIHQVLARCQSKLGGWVGSSVVHLGDHNVPNALMFIDKYTQVPRILNPVVLVASQLEKLCEDEGLRAYVESTFGGVERCRKTILADFFRHAFDGSGADNFFDEGRTSTGDSPVAGTGRTRSRRRVTTRCLSSRGSSVSTEISGEWERIDISRGKRRASGSTRARTTRSVRAKTRTQRSRESSHSFSSSVQARVAPREKVSKQAGK